MIFIILLLFIGNTLGVNINSLYHVEDTIDFGSIDQGINYVYLLNSLDSDTEHSKALYSNMTKVLDTRLDNLNNSWKIPYSVNYIPSLGTNFNLIFTEFEVPVDHFKESNLLGIYEITDNFIIETDKDIGLSYNNDTIFQPGYFTQFNLTDFQGEILIDLLSKQSESDNWIMYPSMQRFIHQRSITDDNYNYFTPIDLQRYFVINFKIRFTEIYDGIRTKYSLESNIFNIPGLTITNYIVDKEFIDIIIEWANFNGDIIVDVTNKDLDNLFNSYNMNANSIKINNEFNTGNYTFKICAIENTNICDNIDIELFKNETFNNLNNNSNDYNLETEENEIHWADIVAISFGVFFGVMVLIVLGYYMKYNNKVHPYKPRQNIGYNNHIYENPSIYGKFNRDINGNSLPPLRENKQLNIYNKLDHHKAIVNDVYHIAVNYREENPY
jgi:hypothetical protein